MKKYSCQQKICFANTKNALQSKSLLSLPLCPSWSRIKLIFFHFFIFWQIWAHNFKLGWTPQPLLLATNNYHKKMADDVRPRTRSSIGAPSRGQPPRKNVARSVGPSKTDVNTANPPKNKNESKKSPNPSTMHPTTTSPVKG